MAPDDSGALHCPRCGAVAPAAEMPCPACGLPVGAQADACPTCGEPISLFGQVMTRHADTRQSPLWLEQARGQARGVRLEEEYASQRRFEVLEASDRRRLVSVEQAELAQQRKDRLVIQLGLATAVILGLLFVGLALVYWLR
jgi:hypothetical protein